MNAVQAMRLNGRFTHENHRFRVERIFYLTKITRYTIFNNRVPPHTCWFSAEEEGRTQVVKEHVHNLLYVTLVGGGWY